MTQVQSLALELSHAEGTVTKQKKKQKPPKNCADSSKEGGPDSVKLLKVKGGDQVLR